MRWAHFHQVRNSTIVLPLGHLLRVFYTSAVYFTLPQLFTLPQCILHFPNGLWQQMPPQKQPIDAQCIVLFVCWAHFLPYCSTGDASSETPIRHILYYTFRMLSILPPMLFCIKCILRSTHQAHNILYFSYVEYTSVESEPPPLYCLSVIYYAGRRLHEHVCNGCYAELNANLTINFWAPLAEGIVRPVRGLRVKLPNRTKGP